MPGKRSGKPREETTIARQKAFCDALSMTGSITNACASIGLSVETYYTWKKRDTAGFRAKLEDSGNEFGDYLHYMALDTVRNQKPSDNPALKIFMLKAWHSRYKAVDTSVTDDVGKEVMSELKKALREEKSKPSKPEEPIDGKSLVEEQVNRILESKTNDSSPDRDKAE